VVAGLNAMAKRKTHPAAGNKTLISQFLESYFAD
jgi:hypothetical protein